MDVMVKRNKQKPQTQVGAAFSVMTEMERLGVAPDEETLHLMVRTLMQAKEPDVDKVST